MARVIERKPRGICQITKRSGPVIRVRSLFGYRWISERLFG